MLVGAGASRPGLVVGAVGARLIIFVAIVAAWAVVLQAGSVVLGLGFDGPLAVHTLAVGEGLVLAMLACAAASSVVGPAAAGLFGGGVFVLAQAAVNLKAAANQGLIGTADTGVSLLYYIAPRTITSPMIADLQARDVAGPAAPRVEINQNTVLVPPAGWDTVVWTLAWCVLLGLLCAAGLRRRPLKERQPAPDHAAGSAPERIPREARTQLSPDIEIPGLPRTPHRDGMQPGTAGGDLVAVDGLVERAALGGHLAAGVRLSIRSWDRPSGVWTVVAWAIRSSVSVPDRSSRP